MFVSYNNTEKSGKYADYIFVECKRIMAGNGVLLLQDKSGKIVADFSIEHLFSVDDVDEKDIVKGREIV